jgi:hypothetical protein
MNVIATTVPATVQIRRSHLLGLIATVAAVAIASTWAIASNGNTGAQTAQNSVQTKTSVLSTLTPSERQHVQAITSLTPTQLKATFGTGTVNAIDALGLTSAEEKYVLAITSMTPAQLKAAFGTGFNAARADAPMLGSNWPSYWPTVLASLTPSERQHVQTITSMTPAQLVAAFGTGH